MARKVVRSEEVSKFANYLFCSDGKIIDAITGKEVKPYSSGVVRLYNEDTNTFETPVAHRLIAEAFVENPNGYKFVKFKDGDPTNRAADNLEWVPGVKPVGTTTQEIAALWQNGMSVAEIAHFIGKTPQYVSRVVKRHKERNPFARD